MAWHRQGDTRHQASAQTGDFVVLDYTGKLVDGEVFDSSKDGKQLEFIVGERRDIKGLDKAVVGMQVGESRTATLAPAEAFGEVDQQLILEAPRPAGVRIQAGDKVSVSGMPGRVVAADDKLVKVDLNPELAGQTVTFDLTLQRLTPAANLQRATFGAGCFWGVELAFQRVPGVLKTEVGYSNGEVDNPTYEDVCMGTTGHAEVVQVVYDEKEVPYEQLLEVFWKRHDPTTLNRQGNDVGTQYRSGIYYHTEAQKAVAEKSLAEAQAKFRDQIVTEVVPVNKYYPAEEYHQQYLAKGGRFNNPQSTVKGCTDPIRCYG